MEFFAYFGLLASAVLFWWNERRRDAQFRELWDLYMKSEEKAARLNQRLMAEKDRRPRPAWALEHEKFNEALSQLSFLDAARVLRRARALFDSFPAGFELPSYLAEHYRAAYQAYQRGEEQLGKDTADMESEFAHLPADDESTEDGPEDGYPS